MLSTCIKKVQNKSDCLQTKYDKTFLYVKYSASVMHAKINKRLGSVLHYMYEK